jgi:DNA helicase-2/ATP-dependent DNA helicase PcrA
MSGIGSKSYLGFGSEKRGSRRGIYGSGTTQYDAKPDDGGYVHGYSSAGDVLNQGDSAQSATTFTREKIQFFAGDSVDHRVFGRGKVISVEGDAIVIYFDKLNQQKKLLTDLAPIVKLA